MNHCDVVVEYWVNDVRSMKDLASDLEWIQTMALDKDENDWLDTSKSTIRISYDMTTYPLEYGAIINVAGQKRRSRVTSSFD